MCLNIICIFEAGRRGLFGGPASMHVVMMPIKSINTPCRAFKPRTSHLCVDSRGYFVRLVEGVAAGGDASFASPTSSAQSRAPACETKTRIIYYICSATTSSSGSWSYCKCAMAGATPVPPLRLRTGVGVRTFRGVVSRRPPALVWIPLPYPERIPRLIWLASRIGGHPRLGINDGPASAAYGTWVRSRSARATCIRHGRASLALSTERC